MINYGKQSINEDDIRAVEAVLRSDHLTCGPKVEEFEVNLAEYTGAKYAIAVSNGTAALHLLAITRKPADVYVPDITFMATGNAFAHVGSKVHLVDIESNQPMLPPADYNGLAIPVHMAGFPIDVSQFECNTIEDGCHALGASIINPHTNSLIKVGSCKHSMATAFSFHPVKPITTGEGGAITTNDEELAKKLKHLRSHGIEDLRYTMNHIGLNYRMSEMQAALGISQLKRLDTFIERRREIAAKYDAAFDKLGIVGIKEQPNQYSGYHLYTIRVGNQHAVRKALLRQGIRTQVHYKPMHELEYYAALATNDETSFTNATQWANTTISIPIYPDLDGKTIDKIIKVVLETATMDIREYTSIK